MTEFFIAGVQHHQMHKILNQLEEGTTLDLVPDPENKYDPNAIRIEFEQTMLGYVPKRLSAEVSAVLESNDKVFCKISYLNKSAKPWEQCKVTILSEDELVAQKEHEDSLEPYDPSLHADDDIPF